MKDLARALIDSTEDLFVVDLTDGKTSNQGIPSNFVTKKNLLKLLQYGNLYASLYLFNLYWLDP